MALLVMVVLSAGLAAGFTATSSEVMTNAAYRGDNRAFQLAQAGLEQFLARRKEVGFCTSCIEDPSLATTAVEETRVTMTGGYADIRAAQVRAWVSDALPAIWYIQSTGVDESTKISGASSSISGTRSVAVYASWGKAVVNVQGAWFALSGLTKSGASGNISGVDQCSSADGGGKATLPGAMVPTGQFTGKTDAFQGDPPLDLTKSFDQLKSTVKLDWAGILAGSITPDFDVPTVAFPNTAWFTSHPDEFPIIRIRTSGTSLLNAGRGMLIVGGALRSNGNNTTAGATLSGLNLLLGGTPANSSDDSDANGTKTYVYNSCMVEKASSGLRFYRQMSNTWTDAVATW
jgi:hypothetical protein